MVEVYCYLPNETFGVLYFLDRDKKHLLDQQLSTEYRHCVGYAQAKKLHVCAAAEIGIT